MSKRKLLSIPAGLAAVAALAFLLNAEAEDPKPEARVATVAQLMGAIAKPNMPKIMAGASRIPASDSDWEQLAASAALLNEIGHVLMEGGRCPDAVWAEAAAGLRATTAAIVDACAKKDHEAVKANAPKVGLTCKQCHDVHKK